MTNEKKEIFVGIEISKKTLEVALDSKGKTHRFSNDQNGLDSLVKTLSLSQVMLIVVKATYDLENPAVTTLYKAGFLVIVANPHQSKYFARELKRLAKTGSIDAKVLSQYAKILHSDSRRDQLLYKPKSPKQLLLELVERRSQLIDLRRTEEGNMEDFLSPSIQQSIQVMIKKLNDQITILDASIKEILDENFNEIPQLSEDTKV
jgi:transposase